MRPRREGAGNVPEQSATLEDALGVLLVEGEEHAGSVAELVQRELHAPELTLVAETILADDLELTVETLLLERTTRLLEGLGVC